MLLHRSVNANSVSPQKQFLCPSFSLSLSIHRHQRAPMQPALLLCITVAVAVFAIIQRHPPQQLSTRASDLLQTIIHTTSTITRPAHNIIMGNTQKSTASATEAAKLIDDAIATHPVVIFSKSYCPFCISAKRDIASAGRAVSNFQPPKIYELDHMAALGSAVQARLAKTTGRRTVPNVFIGGKPVGGGDEISGYARRGALKQMLTQAPDRIAASHTSEASDFVENALRSHPVVIFSKTTCPYCKAAKAALSDVATRVEQFQSPQIYELNTMGALGSQIQQCLAEKTGRRTVPNVFISGHSIGGGDDVRRLASTGELDSKIAAAIGGSPAYAPKTPKQFVENAIAEHPVTVFSKSYCPYCISAKRLLKSTGDNIEGYQPPEVFELDEMSDGEAIQEYLLQSTGQHTVPNIFIGGQHIGGNSELQGVARDGELVHLLKEAQSSASSSPVTESTETSQTVKEIVFGAGCFWGVELAFQRVKGVVKTEVGYSNGKVPRVSYDAVCTGLTGAAEVVRVWYDPSVASLSDLLTVWESRHDPTSLNKQGNDVGTQYRSAVFYHDQEQADEIAKWNTEAATRLGKPIVTDIAPVKNYCEAEEYHQRYLEKKGQNAEKGASTAIRCYG